MLPRSYPDGIHIAFDDHRLVNNAGLILPSTLARHLGLPQLVQECLDLGNAPGRANPGDKMMTLVASALAGGDCIDVLRTGRTAGTLGGTVKAPSTLGTFLRSFRWGTGRVDVRAPWDVGAGCHQPVVEQVAHGLLQAHVDRFDGVFDVLQSMHKDSTPHGANAN